MFVAIDQLRIYVERVGQGPPALLLHGWGANARSMASIARWLATDYTVWSFDLPGFGSSQIPDKAWGIYEYADFVRHAMARLEIARAHVIGHSNGGRIGIILGARSPDLVDHLVLVDSAGIRPPRTLGLRLRGFSARTGRRLLGHPRAGKTGQRALTALYTRLGMSDYRDAGPLRPTFIKIVNEDLSPLLPQVAVPTLVVWGARDGDTPLWMGRQMAEQIPNAELVVIENAGHYAYADAPEPFERALRRFLGQKASRPL